MSAARRLSLPHEHGGYLTVVGATAAAALVSPAPGAALGVGVALAAAFLARGPVERAAPPAPWDRAALALLAACGLAGVLLAGRYAAAAAGMAGLMIAGALVSRRARRHRSWEFETAGLAALGASGGVATLAGGADPATAAALGLLLAIHAALAVPLVRTRLRRGERAHERRALVACVAVLAASAAVAAALGRGPVALALAPRAAQVILRALRQPAPLRPAQVGLRETASLAAAVAIAAVVLVG